VITKSIKRRTRKEKRGNESVSNVEESRGFKKLKVEEELDLSHLKEELDSCFIAHWVVTVICGKKAIRLVWLGCFESVRKGHGGHGEIKIGRSGPSTGAKKGFSIKLL